MAFCNWFEHFCSDCWVIWIFLILFSYFLKSCEVKEKYWSHQGAIWQLVGDPGSDRASCAQQMPLFCPLLSSLTTTDDPKNPFLAKPFSQINKSRFTSKSNVSAPKNPLSSKLFVEKLIFGRRQIFLLGYCSSVQACNLISFWEKLLSLFLEGADCVLQGL